MSITPFIAPIEIFDIILMTLVVGYVFMDTFRPAKKAEDVLDKYMNKSSGFDWHAFWFAAMVTAPAIILHELGHKTVALSFGLTAVFNAAYIWLVIAVVLKLAGSPFIFFVPAYVSIGGNATFMQQTIIAFAGPGVNLILFLIALIVLKMKDNLSTKAVHFWTLTRRINLFLFIFNIIPIPGFDGFTVFSGIGHVVGLL
jgi:Zn-dependent protease